MRRDQKADRRPLSEGRKPRVLYVTNQLPFPAHSGGQVREANLICGLADQFEIHLVAVTKKFERDVSNVDLALDFCESVRIFEANPVAQASMPARVAELASPPRVAELASPLAAATLASIAFEFDLLHVEGYFLMQFVPHNLEVPVVLCAENVEFTIVRQHCTDEAHDNAWKLARKFERKAWRRAALVTAVTDDDAAAMRRLESAATFVSIPNGSDHVPLRKKTHSDSTRGEVLFLGNFGWSPTRLGAMRLLKVIWPKVAARNPAARLRLVGAGADSEVVRLATRSTGVDYIGEVASIHPEFARADIFVSPISSGSGSMVKMAEALCSGAAIVANETSIRGFPSDVRACVKLADTDDEFASAILHLLADAGLRQHHSTLAHAVGLTLPTWRHASNSLAAAWMSVSREGRRR